MTYCEKSPGSSRCYVCGVLARGARVIHTGKKVIAVICSRCFRCAR